MQVYISLFLLTKEDRYLMDAAINPGLIDTHYSFTIIEIKGRDPSASLLEDCF